MRVFPDYYAALGVPSDASSEDIERAYRRMVDAAVFRNLEERDGPSPFAIKCAEEAYDVLTHPEKRRDYDAWYVAWLAGIQEIQEPTQRTAPEAARRPCPRCNGSGRSECLACEGQGTPECPGCGGRGEHACVVCLGLGTLAGILTYDVRGPLESQTADRTITAEHAPQQEEPTDPGLRLQPSSVPLTPAPRGARVLSPAAPIPDNARAGRLGTVLLAAAVTLLVLYSVRNGSVAPAPRADVPQTVPTSANVSGERAVVAPAPRAPAPLSTPRRSRASGKERAGTDLSRAKIAPRTLPRPAAAMRAPVSGRKAPERPRVSRPTALATPRSVQAPVRIPPVPKETTAPAPVAPQPVSEEPSRELIGEAVLDLVASWAESILDSNLDGHMSHYADVLERYFTKRNMPWWSIYNDKRRFLLTYPTVVEYRIRNLQIIPISADLAYAVFDKTWDFRMHDNRRFAGEERQRLKVRQHSGRWRIVSEEELQVYWVVRPVRE